MPSFRNINELTKALDPYIKQALDNTANQIQNIIETYLQKYYDNYDPIAYKRTFQFLNSCTKSKIVSKNGTHIITIYIDTENLHYKHDFPGLQVVKWANEGKHGGLEVGDSNHFWDDSKNEINTKEIIFHFAKYLQNLGWNLQ